MNSTLARLKSPWVLLIFAVGLAALVAYIAYAYLQQREQRIKDEVVARNLKNATPKIGVVVPKEDARVGVVLNQSMFVSREVDQDLVYPDTVLARDFANVQGQKLARPVLRGRPLRITDLQAPDVNDVAKIVPAGLRAVTIESDNLNSIAQTLRPGHRVDVFLLSKATKPKDVEVPDQALEQATLFMQNMLVVATGQEFQDVTNPNSDAERAAKMARPGEVEGNRQKGFDTVTLLVTPAEASRLLVGQKMGSYRVALRGRQDDAAIALAPLKSGDLMPARAAGRDSGVEFIVGGRGGGGGNLVSTLVSRPTGPVPERSTAGSKDGTLKSNVEQVLQGLITPKRKTEEIGSPASQPIPAIK